MLKVFKLFVLLVMFSGCWSDYDRIEFDKSGPITLGSGPIVCFGDSLTSGYGADKDYPYYLKSYLKLGDRKIINNSSIGRTTEDALKLLNEVLDEKPSIVILNFGANDIFNKEDFKTISSNFNDIINELTGIDAVVIVARFYNDNMYANIDNIKNNFKQLFSDQEKIDQYEEYFDNIVT